MKNIRMTGLTLALSGLLVGFASQANAEDIDVKSSEPAKKAAEVLKNLGHGNERSGGFESLVLDTDDRSVRGEAFVRSRHRVKTPFGKKTIYDWKVSADFRFDLDDGHGDATIDFGRGIKIKVRELAEVLAAL